MPNPESVRLPATHRDDAAPYFANYVTDQLVSKYGAEQGLRRRAQGHDDDRPRAPEDRARRRSTKVLPPSIGPTAALVSIDVHTGDVLAMVGGRNYHVSQFNLATQGERQPGSAFKPFVLAAALRDGISPGVDDGLAPGRDRRRRPGLERDQLRAREPRARSTCRRRSRTRTTPSSRSSRISSGRRTSSRRPSRWGSRRRSTPTSRSGSAPSRRHRSRWRAPTRRSRTAATGSTARSSATSRAPFRASRSRARAARRRCSRTTRSRRRIDWLTNGNAAIEDQMLQGVVQYGTGTAAQLPG